MVENDIEFDLKKLWGSFTADSIGKCCFAVDIDLDDDGLEITKQINSKNKSIESQFIKNMNKMVHIPMIKFILFVNLPKFIRNNLMCFRFFPNNSIEYFRQLIDCIVERRKSIKDQYANDFLQFLFEHNDDYLKLFQKPLNKTSLRLSSDEIIAQCLIFMVSIFKNWIYYFNHIDKNLNIFKDRWI